MGLNLNNLPEKEYYTFQEMADRWGCDTNLVEQLIEQNQLRAAANLKELPIRGLIIDIENLDKESPYYIRSMVEFADWDPMLDDFANQRNFYTVELDDNELPIKSSNLIAKNEILSSEKLKQYRYLYLTPTLNSLSTNEGNLVMCVDDTGYDHDNDRATNLVLGIPNREYFKYITKLERDRFENDFGITSDTTDIKLNVSAKTENIYLKLIQIFAEVLLGDDLTDKPHSNAAKIDRLLGKKDKELPCTIETLANYLNK